MKKVIFFILLAASCIGLVGCGETLAGVGKDVNRMGKGTSTFFFRQPQ